MSVQKVGRLDDLSRWQAIGSMGESGSMATYLDRALVVSLLLFGLTVPHSIAAAQISYLGGMICWLLRNSLSLRRSSTPRLRLASPLLSWRLNWPLLLFLLLTLLSSIFSYYPSVSLIKSRSVGLFIVFYLISVSLTRRGAIGLICCLLISSLVGVGYGLAEKVTGRGMVIEHIEPWSPLAGRGLQPGDVIWMVGRRRVRSLEEARAVVARYKVGEKIEVEALHAGDPTPPEPVKLTVTEELRHSVEAFGLRAGRSTRQFRISGFSRQFITYAEQMQLLGLLLFGFVVAGGGARWWRWSLVGMVFFTGGLVLTATRSVIASFVAAVVVVSFRFGGKRTIGLALLGAVLITGVGTLAVISARREMMGRFGDESTSRRLGYMKAGLRVALEHPLLGVGIDSHKHFWKEWGFPGDYVTHTHSTPIQVAMDRGLPALGCLIWMGVAAWIGLRRLRKKALAANDLIGIGLTTGALASLLGFSLSSLINYNFGDSETLLQLLTIIGTAGVIGGGDNGDEPGPDGGTA